MKKILSVFLAFIISASTAAFAEASLLEKTASYVYETVKNPQVGSVGGEWAILGLARSGMEIPDEYFDAYYKNVERYVKDCGGILHQRKYTEYSRVIIALTAIGKDPSDVAGYSLLTPLGDYEKTVSQGINGPVWALIALDCGGYEMPVNTDARVQATREMYLDYILEKQLPDGGWAMSGKTTDADVTGMVLQALSDYQNMERVKAATNKALENICDMTFTNCEGYVQMIVALCELGISPGISIPETYCIDKGFRHELSETSVNLMATEQCLYALAAESRFSAKKPSLYNMSDVIPFIASPDEEALPPVTEPGKTFEDIQNHQNREAIEALARRGIINGKSETAFEPDSTMTRAEFAAIITRGIGLTYEGASPFADVRETDWFFGYINAARHFGIVYGVSETEFNPHGTITREEAAVMVARGAACLGMETAMEDFAVRNILAVFPDYVTAAEWSVGSLAFCYDKGILSQEAIEIQPKEAVTRAEIAQMVYNLTNLL